MTLFSADLVFVEVDVVSAGLCPLKPGGAPSVSIYFLLWDLFLFKFRCLFNFRHEDVQVLFSPSLPAGVRFSNMIFSQTDHKSICNMFPDSRISYL